MSITGAIQKFAKAHTIKVQSVDTFGYASGGGGKTINGVIEYVKQEGVEDMGRIYIYTEEDLIIGERLEYNGLTYSISGRLEMYKWGAEQVT